jgi:hypothetical protein
VEVREIAEAVCHMASDFRRLHDRSMLDLLKSSGYLDAHDAITEQHLQALFEAKPDLIHSWIVHSGNRRTRYGYYFLGPDNTSHRGGDWMVGYYPGGKEEHFSDGPAACARFVKLEAENLRYMIEGRPPIKARR